MRRLVGWPLLSIGAVAAVAWVYIVYMAHGFEDMVCGEMLLMPSLTGWKVRDLWLVFVMWTLMMAAMMLPSASSMLHAYETVGDRIDPSRHRAGVIVFALGYLAAWTAYSVFATGLQWLLLELRLISPYMESASLWLAGSLLVLAGLYQFTPWKNQCLTGCRSPVSFISQEWRPGAAGAARMGWRHGIECVGCSWVLMLLLFVLGVMNLAWNIALSVLVVAEKHVPNEKLFLRISGSVLIFWGCVLWAMALLRGA